MSEHTSEEVKEAESVLHNSDQGRRIFVAENALKLMNMGYLPRLERLFFGARHEVRRVTNHDSFRERFEHSDLVDFNLHSSPLGYVVSTLTKKGAPHTAYYCTEELTEEVVSMLTSSIAKQHAVNLSALGLDMSGVLDAEDTKQAKPK